MLGQYWIFPIGNLLIFRNPEKMREHGIEWIKQDKLIRIVDTKWIVVYKKPKKSIARIVQLNINPINLFWIIFWKLFYKMKECNNGR